LDGLAKQHIDETGGGNRKDRACPTVRKTGETRCDNKLTTQAPDHSSDDFWGTKGIFQFSPVDQGLAPTSPVQDLLTNPSRARPKVSPGMQATLQGNEGMRAVALEAEATRNPVDPE
jgi:hypothetical protein